MTASGKSLAEQVAQHSNDIESIYEMLGEVRGTVRRLERISDDHGRRLRRIETTQLEHGATLAQHTAVLAQHTAVLDQHTAVLDQHTAVLDQHTATLAEHGGKLDRIIALLEAG